MNESNTAAAQTGAGNRNGLSAVNAPIPAAMDRAEILTESVASLLESLEKRLQPYLTQSAETACKSAEGAVDGSSDFHHRLAFHGERLSKTRDRINDLLNRLTL